MTKKTIGVKGISSLKKSKFRSSIFSRKRTLLVAVLIVLLTYSLVLLLVSVFAINSPYRVEVIPYDFVVKDSNIGFNLNTDILHFGSGPQSSVFNRAVSISASKDSIVKVLWDGPGDLAVDKNDFFLAGGDNTSILFILTIPNDLVPGNYSGNVYFHFFNSQLSKNTKLK